MKNFNFVLVLICALGAVACNNTTPNPTPSPSNGGVGSNGGGGGTPGSGSSPGQVLTQHNDGYRTGQNLNETILTRTNVNPTNFGKIGALPVDGQVYAQPLVASKIKVADGTTHNVVYIATENDSVYAYDADTLSTTPLWKRSLLGDSDYTCPGSTNGSQCSVLTPTDVNAPNVAPEVGITSTPVIDPNAGVIYVVGVVKDANYPSNGLVYWMLHALELGTGKELPGSPVTIEGSLPGTGSGTDSTTDGQIHFDPIRQLQRAGLVLNNGLVYVAFSSFNDQEPSHGWLFSYDAATLEPVTAFITTPNSGEGTIWMAGAAPAVDENGSIYFADGNSDPGTARDFGDSVLKLNFGDQGFDVQDYFTPYNYQALNTGDVEIGSGGVMLVPDQLGSTPHLAIAGGKEGTIYLLNRDSMGQFNSTSTTSDTQIVQEMPQILNDGAPGQDYGTGNYGLPAYYQGKVFFTGMNDFLRSLPLVNGQLNEGGMQISPISIPNRGASPSISANGNANGIVWYIDPGAYTYSWNGSGGPTTYTDGPAVLYAFSTDDLSKPLYASGPPVQANETCSTPPCANPPSGTSIPSYAGPSSDAAGNAVKFTVPTIVNGKVFVGTDTEVSVYGLRSSQVAMNQRRSSEDSLARSVASMLGDGLGAGMGAGMGKGEHAPAAAFAHASSRPSAPFDFWALKSPYRSCSIHVGAFGQESSLY